MPQQPFFILCLLLLLVTASRAFAPLSSSASLGSVHASSSSALAASQVITNERRKTLLSRNGPYFHRNGSEDIEFGATANLVTQLDTAPASDAIATWLRDERGLALSIWDPDLMEEQTTQQHVYRLQVMTLQFVTLELAPWVDVEMKTVTAQSVQDPSKRFPVFRLQSVDFEPNVQILPGMRVTAESLGIVIQVVGELRPSADGMGVTGKISFCTQGKLPPPLRILPQAILKAASDSINNTVADFAVKSFQKGAKAKYREFRLLEAEKQTQEAS